MTTTHLSHFGLEMINETNENILFEGTMAACKRMAFAHGMELQSEIVSSHNPQVVIGWHLSPRGIILRGRDGWNLLMPREVWNS